MANSRLKNILQTRINLPGPQLDLPGRLGIEAAWRSFNLWQRLLLIGLLLVFFASSWWLVWQINDSFLVTVPARGGSLTEGEIGSPRFINPLLATADVDRDLTALIYSGLLRVGPDSQYQPDLAQSYEISPDGKSYTFTLRDDLSWQDGQPITTDDVDFTISRAQDPLLKSVKRASWEGVTVEKLSQREVRLTLKQPYGQFLENLTLGILPKHLWQDIGSEAFYFSNLNIEPVGSGPYQLKKIKRAASGIPDYYDLAPFDRFALGAPKIKSLRLRFYANTDDLLNAYRRNDIAAISIVSPATAAELTKQRGRQILTSPLSRVFGVFFNQNQAKIFADKGVRLALAVAIDKAALVETVLKGYGVPVNGPLPPGTFGFMIQPEIATGTATTTDRISQAQEILRRFGWQLTDAGQWEKKLDKKETLRLAFSLATSDAPELKAVANGLEIAWTKLGATVEVKVFQTSDLNQDVIRPRKYDALLFGQIVGRDPDPYAFWHSSQRLAPGLNIALYTNSTVDKLLEAARSLTDREARTAQYHDFQELIAADAPAVFLYAPSFIYVVPPELALIKLPPITIPADRFLTIYQWYLKTDRVWKIFAR